MMGFGAGLGFGFGSGGLLVLLGCVLLAVGVVIVIALAIGRIGRPAQAVPVQGPQQVNQGAVEVLGLRFARGEMTADEYTAAKQILEAQR